MKLGDNKDLELNSLFNEWEEKVPEFKGHFVRDGIINDELYRKARTKILFIAKEANNPNQTEGDFRSYWQNKLRDPFAYRIAEWSFGVLNDFPPYDEIWKNRSNGDNAIQKIAFMNVKKIAGGGFEVPSEVDFHTKRDIEFIKREIAAIAPELVILGVSRTILRDLLFPDLTWQKSGWGIDIGKFGGIKIVDFYHPSSRNAPSASYCLLKEVINSEMFKRL